MRIRREAGVQRIDKIAAALVRNGASNRNLELIFIGIGNDDDVIAPGAGEAIIFGGNSGRSEINAAAARNHAHGKDNLADRTPRASSSRLRDDHAFLHESAANIQHRFVINPFNVLRGLI